MSFTLHGTGVSGGIAIGHAHLVSHASLEVAHYRLDKRDVRKEVARYDKAVATVRAELETLRSGMPNTAPAEFEAFVNVHLMMLGDAMLSDAPRQIIESERCNAEWALRVQMDSVLEQFDDIEDTYLRERRADVVQVVERLMKVLSGHPGHTPPPPVATRDGVILVAHDLSPADVVQFKQHQCASFITDLGGTTSHTAVVARSLNIPSIVALHNARQLIRENELVIVDGTRGVVIVDPDAQALAEYERLQQQLDRERHQLRRLRHKAATTADGVEIELHANIELPDDVIQARDNGATGIGLFRSEFLFLNRDTLPDEDEQFEAYRSVAKAMHGMPVTIRTYDLGADKQADSAQRMTLNPALGLRAIRLCLTEPQRFLIQLRALLRASHYGRVNILIPMLASAHELDQTLALIAQAKHSLDEAGTPYDRDVRIGGMVEVPAAALALGLFTHKLDFLSVGTNDLIQYLLAVDRTDDAVAHLYDPLHPAVISLLAQVFTTARKARVPTALCGELAGDLSYTRLLLALGLRQFSMHSAHLLDVKQRVMSTDVTRIAPLARRMLRTHDAGKLRQLLDEMNA